MSRLVLEGACVDSVGKIVFFSYSSILPILRFVEAKSCNMDIIIFHLNPTWKISILSISFQKSVREWQMSSKYQ